MEDLAKLYQIRFSDEARDKKDAVWKPLLRGFRIYIRSTLKEYLDVNQIFDGTGDLSK